MVEVEDDDSKHTSNRTKEWLKVKTDIFKVASIYLWSKCHWKPLDSTHIHTVMILVLFYVKIKVGNSFVCSLSDTFSFMLYALITPLFCFLPHTHTHLFAIYHHSSWTFIPPVSVIACQTAYVPQLLPFQFSFFMLFSGTCITPACACFFFHVWSVFSWIFDTCLILEKNANDSN